MADLDLAISTLALEEHVDIELLAEFATLSGFLCHQAVRTSCLSPSVAQAASCALQSSEPLCCSRASQGEIPVQGDAVEVGHVRFDVLEADERRLLSVLATNVTLGEPFAATGRRFTDRGDVPQ